MSTTMSDTTIACPDWCTTNHKYDPDGGHDGPNWPDIPSIVAGHVVTIAASQTEDGAMAVYLASADLPLSPEQAREVAHHLIEAADWAKDHQVSV